MQVYLKQYFELFSLFDDIDSGLAAHAPSGIHLFVVQILFVFLSLQVWLGIQ